MYINANSAEYPRQHNCISKRDFDKLLEKKQGGEMGEAESVLRTGICPLCEPESIEKIDNETERNIKHAIELSFKFPHKTTILTTEEKKKQYLENQHYKGIKNVVVLSGKEAESLIIEYYEQVLT
jgi:hypothetical protein